MRWVWIWGQKSLLHLFKDCADIHSQSVESGETVTPVFQSMWLVIASCTFNANNTSGPFLGLTGSLVTGKSIMNWFEKGMFGMFTCLQARMRTGSSLCETHDCIQGITKWAEEQSVCKHDAFVNDSILFIPGFLFGILVCESRSEKFPHDESSDMHSWLQQSVECCLF